MPILNVLVYPNQGLRVKAKQVTQITPSIKQDIKDMIDTMYAEDGIGLAATQVGIPWRILVIDLSKEQNSPQVFINPLITDREGAAIETEGCLSFPGIRIEVKRSTKVTVTATDLQGKPITVTAEDLMARALQHEIDHLDGVVFTDHISRLKRERAHKKVLKFINDPEAA